MFFFSKTFYDCVGYIPPVRASMLAFDLFIEHLMKLCCMCLFGVFVSIFGFFSILMKSSWLLNYNKSIFRRLFLWKSSSLWLWHNGKSFGRVFGRIHFKTEHWSNLKKFDINLVIRFKWLLPFSHFIPLAVLIKMHSNDFSTHLIHLRRSNWPYIID